MTFATWRVANSLERRYEIKWWPTSGPGGYMDPTARGVSIA